MATIAPKQIGADGATQGQTMVWNGLAWVPGTNVESLCEALVFQSKIIGLLVGVLDDNRFRLPPELEEYYNVIK